MNSSSNAGTSDGNRNIHSKTLLNASQAFAPKQVKPRRKIFPNLTNKNNTLYQIPRNQENNQENINDKYNRNFSPFYNKNLYNQTNPLGNFQHNFSTYLLDETKNNFYTVAGLFNQIFRNESYQIQQNNVENKDVREYYLNRLDESFNLYKQNLIQHIIYTLSNVNYKNNIHKVYPLKYNRYNGNIYFISERINGVCLRELIINKNINIMEYLDYMIQLLDLLEYLHRTFGFIHGNISLDSIYIQEDNTILLTDFSRSHINKLPFIESTFSLSVHDDIYKIIIGNNKYHSIDILMLMKMFRDILYYYIPENTRMNDNPTNYYKLRKNSKIKAETLSWIYQIFYELRIHTSYLRPFEGKHILDELNLISFHTIINNRYEYIKTTYNKNIYHNLLYKFIFVRNILYKEGIYKNNPRNKARVQARDQARAQANSENEGLV